MPIVQLQLWNIPDTSLHLAAYQAKSSSESDNLNSQKAVRALLRHDFGRETCGRYTWGLGRGHGIGRYQDNQADVTTI